MGDIQGLCLQEKTKILPQKMTRRTEASVIINNQTIWISHESTQILKMGVGWRVGGAETETELGSATGRHQVTYKQPIHKEFLVCLNSQSLHSLHWLGLVWEGLMCYNPRLAPFAFIPLSCIIISIQVNVESQTSHCTGISAKLRRPISDCVLKPHRSTVHISTVCDWARKCLGWRRKDFIG